MTPIPTLTAHQLFFELAALDPIYLHAHNGSALRGMVYHAVRELANEPPHPPDIQFVNDPLLRRLLANLDEAGPRGQDVPRPYVIEPPPALPDDASSPVATHLVAPGESLTFGVTLFGDAMEAFPVLVMALRHAGERGLGRFLDSGSIRSRGRFRLARAFAQNPLTRTTQEFLTPGERMVVTPDVLIRHDDVMRQAERDAAAQSSRLRLHFHTPMTLRARGEFLSAPIFSVLVHRLIERLNDLSRHYAGALLPCLPHPDDRDARKALLSRADRVQVERDATHWVPLRGHSDRTRAPTNLSGFVGVADVVGDDFAPFYPILRWGELAHAGQHTVKGNGLFRMQVM